MQILFKKIIKFYLLLLVIFFLQVNSFADEGEIHRLLSLPEEKIDIGTAALIIEKDIFPDIDIDIYSAKIDDLVKKAKIFIKGSKKPDERIRALNTFIYKVEGFGYDYSDPEGKKVATRHLNGILDTKKGNCVSMPLLYISIAQRLGYPVYAVAAPEHIFLRYVDPNLKEQNIEATSGGWRASNKDYIRDLQISKKGIESGTYLETMTNRRFLADLIAGNAIYWANKGQFKRAIRYLEHCVRISPNSAEINEVLGKTYLMYAKIFEENNDFDIALKIEEKGLYYRQRALDLGLVKLPREEYIEHVKKKAKEEALKNKGVKK